MGSIILIFKNKELIWDDTCIDDLKFILEGAADLSSCDLAIVCDRPCYEVFRLFYTFSLFRKITNFCVSGLYVKVYHQRQKFISKNGSKSNDDDPDLVCNDTSSSDEDESSSDEEERRPKFGMIAPITLVVLQSSNINNCPLY